MGFNTSITKARLWLIIYAKQTMKLLQIHYSESSSFIKFLVRLVTNPVKCKLSFGTPHTQHKKIELQWMQIVLAMFQQFSPNIRNMKHKTSNAIKIQAIDFRLSIKMIGGGWLMASLIVASVLALFCQMLGTDHRPTSGPKFIIHA